MKRSILVSLGAVFPIATAIFPTAALAQQPVELKGDVKVMQRVVEDGKERLLLTEPKVVVPGDTLVFTTAYRNVSGEAVKNFVITNALPGGVALAPEGSEAQTVSVDGGKTWGKLAMLALDDGTGGKRPATANDVTHLRWSLAEIKPGADGVVTYLALVR